MAEVLGSNLYVAGWALQGNLPPGRLAEILEGAVKRMGMNTEGLKPTIWQYPLPGGKGGVGHTIYLPFAEANTKPGFLRRLTMGLAKLLLGRQRFASTVFQPLVESFIVADDYPELNRTYVLAVSCLPFDRQIISRYLSRRVGRIINLGELVL